MKNTKKSLYAIWDPETNQGLSSYPQVSWGGRIADFGVTNVYQFQSLEAAKEAVKVIKHLFISDSVENFEILELTGSKTIWFNSIVWEF